MDGFQRLPTPGFHLNARYIINISQIRQDTLVESFPYKVLPCLTFILLIRQPTPTENYPGQITQIKGLLVQFPNYKWAHKENCLFLFIIKNIAYYLPVNVLFVKLIELI
jgi:hypothetical protein